MSTSNADYSTKVFFGNLPWRTSWQDLKDWLKEHGYEPTFTNIGRDRRTNRSKGFGLAEFASEEVAKEVIEKLNGMELGDRKIYIREDRPPETRPKKPRAEPEDGEEGDQEQGNEATGGGDEDKPRVRPKIECETGRLFIGNLAWSVTWKELVDHLSPCGEILYAEILTRSFRGVGNRSMGCALVQFKTKEEAQKAVDTLTDTSINDRKIYLREDRESSYCVFINHIPSKMTWQSLKDMCQKYGDVVRSDRNPKGYGTVRFETEDEAMACIEGLNGTEYEGRELQAMFSHEAGKIQLEAELAERLPEEDSFENKAEDEVEAAASEE